VSYRRLILSLLTVATLVCVAAAPVMASEEGGEDPVYSNVGLVFRILNFLIVAYGAWYLFGRVLPKKFRARAESITGAISEAARAKQDAERLLREADAKLAKLDLEIGVIQENAQRDAAAEAERIRAAAREEAVKIERAAEMEILAAGRAAQMELTALAARLAVESAEAVLRKEMTQPTDESLFRAFLSDLARSAN